MFKERVQFAYMYLITPSRTKNQCKKQVGTEAGTGRALGGHCGGDFSIVFIDSVGFLLMPLPMYVFLSFVVASVLVSSVGVSKCSLSLMVAD